MGLIRLLIFVLFPSIAFAQTGLQVQCEKAGNQVACEQWKKQKEDTNPFAKARQSQQAPQEPLNGYASLFNLFLGLVFWGGVIYGVVYLIKKARHQVRDEEFAKLPKDGPMRVKIEEEFVPPGTFNSKHVPCGLKIDVTVSQKDWHAIANAGLMKYVLFHADGPSGEKYDPENIRPWHVEDLKRPTYASFWDADRMYAAKEQLIDALHNLRSHIDAHRSGPQKERMEI